MSSRRHAVGAARVHKACRACDGFYAKTLQVIDIACAHLRHDRALVAPGLRQLCRQRPADTAPGELALGRD
ncbi:MAG: hypothetical protein A3G24_20080 [Betaproteobacteria bacterium RIFCSPLOWO2_12_FULL_62_13]|nr:MAG: hypothetical protein A3G24_20080 [Betaproteobacteria bacterium RIFCSPLOWO2_12_FULL_62_13]